MKREIILLFCAFLFLGVGILLFYKVQNVEARVTVEHVTREQGRVQEQMMGFFRVVEDLETGVFHVFFPPTQLIARFDPPVQLEIAGTWGLATGAFFAQQPAETKGSSPRCQFFKLHENFSFKSFSWNGQCRVSRSLFSEIFWLDYMPFGTQEEVSLPLRLDEASQSFRVDWLDEASSGQLDIQRDRLRQKAEKHCAGEELPQDCSAALRALALLVLSEGNTNVAAEFVHLSEEAADFMDEVSEELRREFDEILNP